MLPAESRASGSPHPFPRKSVNGVPIIFYPTITVPTATTVPTGKSTGSLQVRATSPLRAAGLLLMNTVGLPRIMVALFDGGFTNAVPGGVGRWGGVSSAVLV